MPCLGPESDVLGPLDMLSVATQSLANYFRGSIVEDFEDS